MKKLLAIALLCLLPLMAAAQTFPMGWEGSSVPGNNWMLVLGVVVATDTLQYYILWSDTTSTVATQFWVNDQGFAGGLDWDDTTGGPPALATHFYVNDQGFMASADINTFAELQALVSDKTLVNEEDVFTIDANWVNTASPWADNEVADALTVTGYMEDADINTFSELQSWVSDKTLLNEEDIFTIDANWVNIASPWAVNEGGTGAATFTDGGILLGSGTNAITVLGVATNGQIPIGDGATDPVLATITGTANEITVTNGAGSITLSLASGIDATKLANGTVTSAELQYVGDVTGLIQNQIDGKEAADATLTDIADGTIAENLVNTANPWDVNEGGTGAATFTDGGILLGSGTGAVTVLGAAANGEIPIGDGTTDPQLATITGTANEVTVTNGAASITLSLPTGIVATKLADGTVTSAELQYVGDVTGLIQNQIDGKEGTLTNSAGLLAALDDEQGTGVAVFNISPTFATGITVPANSISDDELDESAAFDWTGAHTFAADLDLPDESVTPDAEGEIAWDDTNDELEVHDGTAIRVLASTIIKPIQFTITNPKHLLGDSVVVWSNETGHTATILGISAWSNVDNFGFKLTERTNAGAAAGGTVEAVTIADNGTAVFYTSTEITGIDHAAIEDRNCIWYVASADTANWVKVSIRYRIDN